MQRILVTGATGFIGQALVSFLAARGDTAVTILIREAYSQPDLHPLPLSLQAIRPQLGVVYADLRNFRQTVRAVREAEPSHVVHLAARGATEPFLGLDTAVRHNLYGTLNLVRACFEKSQTVRQLITARTPGELSSMNVYAASKAAAWNFCEMYGRTQQWPIHAATIFQAYGPGQTERNIIPAATLAALAGEDFPMSSGRQKRDWIYIDDVCAGLDAMLDADLPPAATVDLGSGVLTCVVDVVEQIYEMVGGNGRPRPGLLPDRPGEAPVQAADAARAKEMIGWRTAVHLPEGLRQTILHVSRLHASQS
ncbi:MAG: NAD-dependent epimerase/dehydratase family protein [Chloroflexi bacterium]|nr:NAD-dependent epimerase/dehydratase family protein [Chloroflexota bacterium]